MGDTISRQYVQNGATKLGELAVGESRLAQPNAMHVDPTLHCWLDPNAVGGTYVLCGNMQTLLKVTRREDGYAVVIRPPLGISIRGPSWEVGPKPPKYSIPVVDITDKEATDGENGGDEAPVS